MVNFPKANNWKINLDEDQILTLSLDRSDSNTNTLNREVLEEFSALLDFVRENQFKGLVIDSKKENGFIAGADIKQFTTFQTPEQAFQLIIEGQKIFDKLEKLPIPTLAYIHGFCLGGGLELALACRYRIAEENPKTKLGLPEVKLGIHPGWGGSVRLLRLIGPFKGLELVLSGRAISAKQALQLGVVTTTVPKRHAKRAIKYYLSQKPRALGSVNQVLNKICSIKTIREWIGKRTRSQLIQKINPKHYPAPFAALQNWVDEGVEDPAFEQEARSISELIVTETAQNLIRVFFLQEKLKSVAKNTDYKPEGIHVIGAGVMGGDIAAFCALKGYRVTLEDQSKEQIAVSLKRALILFKKVLKEPYLIRAAKDRLIPDPAGQGLKHADLVIEAIPEIKDAKTILFKRIENRLKPRAILATNTSTIPLSELRGALRRPDRLIGLHFFNPVGLMPLVEVVSDEYTASSALEQAFSFVRSLDKLPLKVKSSPGFLVNRCLMPYLLESVQLLEEGIPKEAIDHAAEEFGMPMGPIELIDTVGLDVCLYAAESLKQYFQGSIPEKLRVLVIDRKLGKKTGQGFYTYPEDKTATGRSFAAKPIKENLSPNYQAPQDLSDRLILRMLNEALACLREGIVENADYLDAGMIFGAGFPPFRGGPIHYLKEQGSDILLQRLNALVQRHGARFLADVGWNSRVSGG